MTMTRGDDTAVDNLVSSLKTPLVLQEYLDAYNQVIYYSLMNRGCFHCSTTEIV